MKRILIAVLALLILAVPLALADEAAFYEGPVLTFSAPRDAELIFNEMSAISYAQVLYAPGSDETIVSAALPAAEWRDECLASMLGAAAASAVADTDFDAVQGYGAQRLIATTDFAAPGDESATLAPYMRVGEKYIAHIVTIDAARAAYLFIAMMPESAYDGEGMEMLVEEQIDSLDFFDPDAKIMLIDDPDMMAACNPVGEIIKDDEADAFMIYALDTIRDVSLYGVAMDENGNLVLEPSLGEWSELNFGDAVIVRAWFPDVLPGCAFHFIDANGVENTLYITTSGIDGTLMMIEG